MASDLLYYYFLLMFIIAKTNHKLGDQNLMTEALETIFLVQKSGWRECLRTKIRGANGTNPGLSFFSLKTNSYPLYGKGQ
jgi:hypothetical protein